MSQIRLHFPAELVAVLERSPSGEPTDGLLERCREERALWEAGAPRADGREQLREELLHHGRTLRAAGDTAGAELMKYAVAIGTTS